MNVRQLHLALTHLLENRGASVANLPVMLSADVDHEDALERVTVDSECLRLSAA